MPSCPGWTVDDLVAHVAEVQAFWRLVLEAGGRQPAVDVVGSDVAGWSRVSRQYLAAQRAADPAAKVWCWWEPDEQTTAAEVARRQAHEIVVHDFDARTAAGLPTSIPDDVAVDGIDEFLERFLNGLPWPHQPILVELRAGGRSWCVAAGPAKPHLVPPDRADVLVSGEPQDVYLMLWRRVPLSALKVVGHEVRAQQLVEWPDLD